jgi:hypothetical protein
MTRAILVAMVLGVAGCGGPGDDVPTDGVLALFPSQWSPPPATSVLICMVGDPTPVQPVPPPVMVSVNVRCHPAP